MHSQKSGEKVVGTLPVPRCSGSLLIQRCEQVLPTCIVTSSLLHGTTDQYVRCYWFRPGPAAIFKEINAFYSVSERSEH